MHAVYPAIYRDAVGVEQTSIQNDGTTLRMVVRGVEFAGDDFDGLEPIAPDQADLSPFTLYCGSLCACVIEWIMPVSVVAGDRTTTADLLAWLELGRPRPDGDRGGIDRETLLLELHLDDQRFRSCGRHGFFDDELREIQAQLPTDTYLKLCFTCALSEYFPAGYGLFGDLACFRNHKAATRAAQDKWDVFALFDQGVAEYVQETYLCPEFEHPTSSTPALPGTSQ